VSTNSGQLHFEGKSLFAEGNFQRTLPPAFTDV
jgi:hypothetical protein